MPRFERVEIYAVNPDNSEARIVYPRDGWETGEIMGASQVEDLLRVAQFRGKYFSGKGGERYFVGSYDGLDDRSPDFTEDIYIKPGEHYRSEGYERVAERVSKSRPNQEIKVLIY